MSKLPLDLSPTRAFSRPDTRNWTREVWRAAYSQSRSMIGDGARYGLRGVGVLRGAADAQPAQHAAEFPFVQDGRHQPAGRTGLHAFVDLALHLGTGGKEPLQAHARLAGAALDGATALARARREARTSSALLQLASSLARIASPDEMGTNIARAVPDVIGCDRAVFIFYEPEAPHGRVIATHGFDAYQDLTLRSMDVPIPAPRAMRARSRHADRRFLRQLDWR